jgi:predicted transcriptional regulator
MATPDHSLFDDGYEAAADARADADLEAGRVISHAAMKAWLLSWGTPDERPPPQIGD